MTFEYQAFLESELLLFTLSDYKDERAVQRRKSLISNIKNLLRLTVNESYEIPYIAMYKREEIGHLLDQDTADERHELLQFEIDRELALVQQRQTPPLPSRFIRA